MLQILAFITNGTDKQTQAVIEAGGVEMIMELLSDQSLDLHCKRECLWALSNIIVGTQEQMMYIFGREQFVNIIFEYCTHQNPKVVRS